MAKRHLPGDIFLSYAASPEYISGSGPDLRAGIIGIRKVGTKSTKTEAVWWEELHTEGSN